MVPTIDAESRTSPIRESLKEGIVDERFLAFETQGRRERRLLIPLSAGNDESER